VPRKILIIDDEDDIREVAALSLESVAGWEVIKASSGAQGWRARPSSSPTPSCWT
jgi:DNA-binding response OmpR family regulator